MHWKIFAPRSPRLACLMILLLNRANVSVAYDRLPLLLASTGPNDLQRLEVSSTCNRRSSEPVSGLPKSVNPSQENGTSSYPHCCRPDRRVDLEHFALNNNRHLASLPCHSHLDYHPSAS